MWERGAQTESKLRAASKEHRVSQYVPITSLSSDMMGRESCGEIGAGWKTIGPRYEAQGWLFGGKWEGVGGAVFVGSASCVCGTLSFAR